jgi:tetraacyldisaccharide 4'-kinase
MRAPDFWRRGSLSPWPILLSPLAALYSAAGQWRMTKTTPKRTPVPVVCVGNLVAGGAGKTPTAIAVVRRLQEHGRTVHVLSRGYGGRERGPLRVDPAVHSFRDVGDEPLLLARHAPTWVAQSRPAGALAAVEAGAEVIVMDDGHQNPSLIKDVSLLVIDTDYGVGNGRVIPAGPLREPVARGMARADAVVAIGPVSAQAGDETVTRTGGGKPLLRAQFMPNLEAYALADQGVVAFAGIARPEKFFQTLEALGAHVLARHGFADHHPYSDTEIMALAERASAMNAKLVTTEKDAVRLSPEARPMVEAVGVSLEFADEAALERVLRPALRPVPGFGL